MAFFAPEVLALAGLVAVIAGVIRGITGFGGAMVMSPPLALLLGPRVTVPVVLLLEGLAALPMVWQTRRLVRWRIIGPILHWLFPNMPEKTVDEIVFAQTTNVPPHLSHPCRSPDNHAAEEG